MTWELSALLSIVAVCLTARDVLLRLRKFEKGADESARLKSLEGDIELLRAAVRDTSTKLILGGKGRR